MRNSRSSYRTVKSSVLRYSKLRKPVMRTRSPSMIARGHEPATGVANHDHAKGGCKATNNHTPETLPRRRETFVVSASTHKAQIPNTEKATASDSRSQAHGRFE